eukprot:gene4227-3013_t
MSAANNRGIEVGDLVSLPERPTLTLKKATSVDEAISLEKCLGDKSWGRVGVVVAKKDAKTSTVKELFSGHRADYVDEELAFADGSFPGLGDPLCGGALYECQSPSCQKVTCSACVSTGSVEEIPISPSDIDVSTAAPSYPKDNLCNPDNAIYWQSAGVYQQPHWITVTLQPDWDYSCIQLYTQDFDSYSPNSISLFWSDGAGTAYTKIKDISLSTSPMWVTLVTSSEIPPPSSGPQPRKVKIQINNNHMSGIDSKVSNIRVLANSSCPLELGERVRLAPTFAENQGDGWCMGSVKDQRVGVVVAIGGQSINREQRNILVYCAASTTKLALFKASWLERAPPTMKHCVGDLVQLNPTTTCRPVDRTMVAGKCLGRPEQGHIGVVTAIGPMVAGIQRNVQVALLSAPSSAVADDSSACARVSLYCASKLVRAEPWLSTHPQVTAALVQAVERAARKPDGTGRVNGSVLVDRLGVHVWDKMLNLLGASSMLEHVYGWIHACASMDLQASLMNKEVADYYAGVVAPVRDIITAAAVTENEEGASRAACGAAVDTTAATAHHADTCKGEADPPSPPVQAKELTPSPQDGKRPILLRYKGYKGPKQPWTGKATAAALATDDAASDAHYDGLPKEHTPFRTQMAFSTSGLTGPNVFSPEKSK